MFFFLWICKILNYSKSNDLIVNISIFKAHTSISMEVDLHSYHVWSGSILSSLDMRQICEAMSSPLADRMKEYIISNEAPHNFLMHFLHCLGKPPASSCLSLFWWGEETRSTALQYNRDTEHLPGWCSSKDFAYLALGKATIFDAHKWINSFCYLSKMQANFTPSCLFSFQITAPSFRSTSCYSRAEESENQCMRSVCI